MNGYESGNNINDSNEGGLCWYESASPSNAPGRDAGRDGSDSDDKEGPEEDLEREIEGTKTQRRV